jgi:hypothetical protein
MRPCVVKPPRIGKGRWRKRKKTTHLPLAFLLRLFEIFRSYFGTKPMVCFELVMQRNGKKHDENNRSKNATRKSFSSTFFKKFLTWGFPENLLWCF